MRNIDIEYERKTLVVVTRDVAADEPNNFAHRDVAKGELFFQFWGPTWGCCDMVNGIPLSTDGDFPFFEFPRDAVEKAL